MTDKNLNINPIKDRQYILSPAIQSGNDKECSNKDFYQEDLRIPTLGRLGLGMKVVHRRTQIPYTIINFEKEKISKLNLQETINSTIDLMYRTTHPYLFRLLNHYETETHVFLIFEPYDGESLDNIILEGKCNLETALKYFVEVLLALQHMHNFGIYNTNIYPENILIGECVKLTDYGLKMTGKNEAPKREEVYFEKGNYKWPINAYSAPEDIIAISNGSKLTKSPKIDSWNCGILLFEMLTNFKSPFKADSNEQFINSIINADIDLSLINDDFCRELISKLIRKNPEERIDIEDILNIDFIKNISIEQPEIDPSDNIINPDEEEEKSEEENDEQTNLIKRLKAENDYLKKALELCQGLTGEEKNKKKNNNKNENEKSDSKNESNKNILKLIDDNEQNNDDEKEKKSSSSEEIDDIDISSSEDLDNENLYDKCEKYKEKYLNAKKKIKKLQKKNKNLNYEVLQLQKEKKQIQEQKTLNILNNFEKINTSKISDITELSEIVINSVNLFRESQQNLEGLIDKLITRSAEDHISLIEANKKYIDNKGKLFFETLQNINMSEIKQNELELNKEKEERKKMDKKKDAQIAELKAKYEISKKRENLLNDQIKELEKRNNATLELNQNLTRCKELIANK